MRHFLTSAVLALLASVAQAGTGITVTNEYKNEVNIKIQGSGVGGCDIILQPGETNTNDCWCLWGTINYSFCAYQAGIMDLLNRDNETESLKEGRCPAVTGESLKCSDLSSLGNCYDGHYTCKIDASGLCDCWTA